MITNFTLSYHHIQNTKNVHTCEEHRYIDIETCKVTQMEGEEDEFVTKKSFYFMLVELDHSQVSNELIAQLLVKHHFDEMHNTRE